MAAGWGLRGAFSAPPGPVTRCSCAGASAGIRGARCPQVMPATQPRQQPETSALPRRVPTALRGPVESGRTRGSKAGVRPRCHPAAPPRACQREDTSPSRPPGACQVKICGVTRVEDAATASAAGASFVGMIMWPKAKRYVGPAVAREIAAAARAGGAEPVGVFVDESAEAIAAVCQDVGLRIAQLHGDAARAALGELPDWLSTIYVGHVDPAGTIVTALPTEQGLGQRVPDWVLLDGLQGGSGVTISWDALEVPQGSFRRGWMLAGGLTPENVAEAVSRAAPHAVDVSSGVCGPDKLAKDPLKVQAFVQNAVAVLQR